MVATVRIVPPTKTVRAQRQVAAPATIQTFLGLRVASIGLPPQQEDDGTQRVRLGFHASTMRAWPITVELREAQAVDLPFLASTTRTWPIEVGTTDVATIQVPFLASNARTFGIEVQPGPVDVALPLLPSAERTFPIEVSMPPVAEIALPLLTSTARTFEIAVEPGGVQVELPLLASASRTWPLDVEPGAVDVDLPSLPPTLQTWPIEVVAEDDTPWYEANPQFERMSFVMDASGQRAAIWNGEPYGPTGMIPKREATFAECFLITAAAGRSYVPLEGLPYVTDTAENAPLFDGANGRWQFTTDPVPRFNRLYPSTHWTQAQTLQLLQWDYVISGYFPLGSGIAFDGPSITGGHFELLGAGEAVRVWGRIPHPEAGDVLITPIGEGGRFVNLDTHGNGGYDPDYPTQWIPTTMERVDRVSDDIRFTEAVRTMLINPEGTYQGTIVVQGQFFGPARVAGEGPVANRRIAIGWDNLSHIGVDVDGNAVCNTGAGVPLSTPLGSGGNGDPFRLVLSFRDRDDVGGFRDGYDGIRRLAGNGGPVAEHTGKYNGGTGWITRLQFARTLFTFAAENCGAGRYDLVMISPDLMSVEDVAALAQPTT